MDGSTQSAAWVGPSYPLQSFLTSGPSNSGQAIQGAALHDQFLLGDGIGQDYAPDGAFSLDDLLYTEDELNGPPYPADLDFDDDDDDDDDNDEDRKAAVKAAMMGLATEKTRSPSAQEDVEPGPVKLKTENDDSHNQEDEGDCQSPMAPPSSSDEHFEPLELMRDKPGVAGLAIREQNNAEKPVYVNPKQYKRIAKRRVARARLEEMGRLSRERKPYIHESRHKHAVRRPRGPRGRFLTKDELAEREAQSSQTPGEMLGRESVFQ